MRAVTITMKLWLAWRPSFSNLTQLKPGNISWRQQKNTRKISSVKSTKNHACHGISCSQVAEKVSSVWHLNPALLRSKSLEHPAAARNISIRSAKREKISRVGYILSVLIAGFVGRSIQRYSARF